MAVAADEGEVEAVAGVRELREALRPKYMFGPSGGDLRVVGTSNYAPSCHPLNIVTCAPDGAISYERLFADASPGGAPVTYYYPGSFGALVPAGRGWRG